MRISDWSSDVCSSDLGYSGLPLQRRRPMAGTRFATHEVGNQSPSFQDLNLFLTDAALQQAVRREGPAASHEARAAFGAAAGRAEDFRLGRLATANPPKQPPFAPKIGRAWGRDKGGESG